MITMIMAKSKDGVIGEVGKGLPWRSEADMKFFKETTDGNIVIMGSSTWRTLRRALPNRINIVLSSTMKPTVDALTVDTSTDPIIMATADDVLRYIKGKVAFVIGGAETYTAFKDHIRTKLISTIQTSMCKNRDEVKYVYEPIIKPTRYTKSVRITTLPRIGTEPAVSVVTTTYE